MYNRFRNFSLSYPEIWEDYFENSGYELVEKPEHKKRRLVAAMKEEEVNIESYKRYLSQSEGKLKELKEELKDIK